MTSGVGFQLEANVPIYLTDADSIWAQGVVGDIVYFAEELSMAAATCPCPLVVPDVQTFSPGVWTWIKPPGARKVKVIIVGGGGGGGGGSEGAAPYAVAAGGGGGGWNTNVYFASGLGEAENVLVGAGGIAGAPSSGLGIDGPPGLRGGDSLFGSTVSLLAGGGLGGSGCIFTSGVTLFTPPGGSGLIAGGTGGSSIFGSGGNGAAGGGGAGDSRITIGYAGGNGEVSGGVNLGGLGVASYSGGFATKGQSAQSGFSVNNPGGGGGGGGGQSRGEFGGLYGGGGGGGSSLQSGDSRRAGGNGADGICWIISY